MRRAATILVVAVALFSQANAQARDRLTGDDIHALTQSWISATGFLSQARDLLNTESKADAMQILMSSMTFNRRAKYKLEMALQQLPLEGQYPAESPTRIAVEVYRFLIATLQHELDQWFALQQKVITIKTEQEAASIMAATAELRAENDETWKMLPEASIGLTYALVDTERTTNGTLHHLRINTAQRRELLKTIREQFPEARNGFAAGQHPVDAAMGILVTVLAGNHRSADIP